MTQRQGLLFLVPALACALVVLSPPAKATPRSQINYIETTMDLARVCGWQVRERMTGTLRDEQRCESRVPGEIDGVLAGMKLSHVRPWICMPNGTTPQERSMVVRKYVEDHPESLSANVGMVIAAALSESYPCHR